MSNELPYQAECEACTCLQWLEKFARDEQNANKEADARDLARRHLHIVHCIVAEVQA